MFAQPQVRLKCDNTAAVMLLRDVTPQGNHGNVVSSSVSMSRDTLLSEDVFLCLTMRLCPHSDVHNLSHLPAWGETEFFHVAL